MRILAKQAQTNELGDIIELRRDQWKGHVARISNYPGLLEAVQKITWTYSEDKHPYLKNKTIITTLHRFVMDFLYGKEKVQQMLNEGCIIEHLNNDGLDCTYENLHILNEDLNKAKAFTIDKDMKEITQTRRYSVFCTDVYYSHNNKMFQMQLFLNAGAYFNLETQAEVERFICKYDNFQDLYRDWLYVLKCQKEESLFEIGKFSCTQLESIDRPVFILTPEEVNNPFIIRDGRVYINLDAKNEDGSPKTTVQHTAFMKDKE